MHIENVDAEPEVAKENPPQYRSPPARSSKYGCVCFVCEDEDKDEKPRNEGGQCRRISRALLHCSHVTTLLSSCSDIATLMVGPSETKLSCHKALLGFFSEFFDAALYGKFKEGETNIVGLPEEAPDDVVAFLAWIYSGHIECDLNAARLWTLGDRLRSPEFCNDVMYLLMDTYGSYTHDSGQWLSAATVDYIYSHTTEESALRRFAKDDIISDGPLCERALREQSDKEEFKEEWIELIRRGGDVVVDVAMVAGFSNDKDNEEAPYISANQHKYIVNTKGTRSIEDFVNGVKRGALAWEVEIVPKSEEN